MKGRYARVAVALPVRNTFHYLIPHRFVSQELVGCRVAVAFGARRVCGFVISIDKEPDVPEVRELLEVLDYEPCLDEELLALGRWLSGYYHHPLGETLSAMIPTGARVTSRARYMLAKPLDETEGLSPDQLKLLAKIEEKGGLAPSAIYSREVKHLAKLVEMGAVIKEWRVDGPPTSRADVWVRLDPDAPPPVDVGSKRPQQRRLLETLAKGPATLAQLRSLDIKPDAVKRAEANGWVVREREPPKSTPTSERGYGGEGSQRLTGDQRSCLAGIVEGLDSDDFAACLLRGVTGSGKTEVYLNSVTEALARGMGAIVLVPEIGLTPQLIGRFSRRLGDELAVLHSGLGERERRLQWEAVRSGRAKVVVGTRSAVFAPVNNLGLLVVDEEHDTSYKQEEGLCYNGKHAGLWRLRRVGGTAVLGSATPELESYQAAKEGRWKLLELPERISVSPLPEIGLVDLRQEEGRRRSRVFIGEPLKRAVEEALGRGEQALFFINRRGFSPALYCTGCGWTMRCEDCAVPMTLHRTRAGDHRVVCHYCNASCGQPVACPECNGTELVPAGAGTQRIEERLAEEWPGARIARLDRDTAGGDGGRAILSSFHSGDGDILVGTQMVVKGHHFPNLTVVGVLDGDSPFAFPDFRGGERGFQMLTQVSGRAGRGVRPGRVYIQTRNPDNPVFDMVLGGDYVKFAEGELAMRHEAGYPPFTRLALIRVSAEDEKDGWCAAVSISQMLAKPCAELGVMLLGPAPAVLERLRGRHRFQLMLKSPDTRPAPIQKVLRWYAGEGRSVIDRNVRVKVDVDPVSML